MPENTELFRKNGSYDSIIDPITGVKMDMSHMQATLSAYLSGSIIPDEWAGWAGDMHTYSKTLKKLDNENSIKVLSDFAAKNIATKGKNSESFEANDLLADIDARNVAQLIQSGMNLSDALHSYYMEGGVENRYTSFVESYGGLSGFYSELKSNNTSLLNIITVMS
jgi:hypothetical protein